MIYIRDYISDTMNERQKQILDAIVREYVKNAEPVGSESICEFYGFDVSPATIRNDMVFLEKEGYIYQPHTSAGRVPTDKGYRFFVNDLMAEKEPSEKEKLAVKKQLNSFHDQYEQMVRHTVRLLSQLTYNASLATTDHDDFYYSGLANVFRQPEYRNTAMAQEIAEMIDNLEEFMHHLPEKNERRIYIGEETPIGKSAGCSVILAPFEMPEKISGWIGVLGPTRMPYERTLSLVDYMADILSSDL